MAITYSQHADLTLEDIHALVRWEVVNTAARLALVLVAADKHKVCYQADNNTYWVLADHAAPTWVEWTTAGAAAVTSVFGEIGDVSEADANFTAADIANVPAGTVAATDVQAAIDELEAEKAPATHTHVLSQVTDAGTAAAEDVGVTLGDIPQLEDVGGGTPGLPAVDGSQLTGVAGGGSAITVTDEGGAPLTTDVVSFDFVGTGVTASSVGDDVTVTIAAGAAPIDTVFGRTGTVVATPSDYDASQVDNDSTVTGAFVDDALNTLDTDKAEGADARFPTTDEKGALAGTGTPSGSNLYVTADTLAAKTHTLSEITDAGTAAGKDTGTGNDDVPLLAQGPYATDGALTLTDGAGNTINVMGWGIYQGTANADAFEFGGETQAAPRLTYFRGARSNANATKAGAVIVSGGVAAGTNSSGGDIEIYGGVGTTADGDTRIGGYDNGGTDVPVGGDLRMLKGFTIAETASAPYTTAAGRGQLWPRTFDGAIMWTDSSDVEHNLTTGGGSSITVEDDGTPLTTAVTKLNFAGAVVLTEPVADEITVTVTPGSAPVASVFDRVDAVLALASDYDASQVDNDANDVNGNVSGAYVANALDTADVAIESAQSDATGALADAAAAQSDATAAKTKTDYLSPLTGTIDMDQMDIDVAANNAKRSYPVADEALVDGHETTLANVATPITTAGAALLDDANTTEQRTTLGLGSAALGTVGVTIGEIVQLVNVGGNPGFPTLAGDNLTGIPTGAETFLELTDVGEPDYVGHAGEFVKVNVGATGLDFGSVPGGGDLLSTNNLSDVTNAITATQNLSVEVGVDVAAFGHTHDVLSNIDNTSGNGVLLGRDTAGIGNSEELTPAEAAALLDHADLGAGIGTNTHAQIDTHIGDTTNPHATSLSNLEGGTHNDLETASFDSGKIFASFQENQLATLTAESSPVDTDLFLMERASDGKYRKVAKQDLGSGITTGVAASRPAADGTQEFYYATDTQVLSYDDSGTWEEVGVVADDATLELTTDLHVKALGVGTAELAANAVTNAKLAQMPTLTIKGNNTGGLADPSDLLVSEFSAMVDHDLTDSHVAEQHTRLEGNTTASKPAADGSQGFYFDTDTGAFDYDSGTWVGVGPPVDDLTLEVASNELRVKDNGITLAKMAGGTDGNLITYDAAGDPAYVATGTATHVLTSNGAGAAPTFQAAAGGGFDYAATDVFIGQWTTSTISAAEKIYNNGAGNMSIATQFQFSRTWNSIDYGDVLMRMAIGNFFTIYDADGSNYWTYEIIDGSFSSDANAVTTIGISYVGGTTTTAPSNTDAVRMKFRAGTRPQIETISHRYDITLPSNTTNYVTYTNAKGWADSAMGNDIGTSISLGTSWGGWIAPRDGEVLSVKFSGIANDGSSLQNVQFYLYKSARTNGSNTTTDTQMDTNQFSFSNMPDYYKVHEETGISTPAFSAEDAVGVIFKRASATAPTSMEMQIDIRVVLGLDSV